MLQKLQRMAKFPKTEKKTKSINYILQNLPFLIDERKNGDNEMFVIFRESNQSFDEKFFNPLEVICHVRSDRKIFRSIIKFYTFWQFLKSIVKLKKCNK